MAIGRPPANTYKPNVCQEAHSSVERNIFVAHEIPNVITHRLLCLRFATWSQEKPCTKHLSRLTHSPLKNGEVDTTEAVRPRNSSVPSYRPTQCVRRLPAVSSRLG